MKRIINNRGQINKYYLHKKMFDIEDSVYLNVFEDLLKSDKDYELTCTCKIRKDKVYPCRYFIDYLDKSDIYHTKLIFNFLKKIAHLQSTDLNYSYLRKIFDKNLDFHAVNKIGAGIDIRKSKKDSRVKIYIAIKDSKDKLQQASEIFGNLNVRDIMKSSEFIIGVDLFFDGRTKIKLYQTFYKKDLRSGLLENSLRMNYSKEIIKMIRKSEAWTVCLTEGTKEKALNFHITAIEFFISKIRNKMFEDIRNKIITKSKGISDIQLITLSENEINNDDIKNVKIYY